MAGDIAAPARVAEYCRKQRGESLSFLLIVRDGPQAKAHYLTEVRKWSAKLKHFLALAATESGMA